MKKYKYSIDGLRAISILLVLFYHIKFPFISGGFIGVDVFFVISGFLITGIIHPKIKEGNFSYSYFYNKRVKRILPIFYVVIFVTIVAGYFILLPSDYLLLAKSSLFSSLFLANIFTIFETSGYFSASTETMPLLHIWSLSVEEQFYFFWPFLLYFFHKTPKKYRLIFIVFLALTSFILAEVLNGTKLSYFLLPTRAGELVLGGIASIWLSNINIHKVYREFFTLLGVLLILFLALYIDKSTAFPGVWSILPCFAALLVIVFSDGSSVSRILLENKLFIHLGRLSYGMYLWHWPIVAYATYLGFDFEIGTQISIIFLTYLFSLLSFHLVESPIRYSNLEWSHTIKLWLVIPISTISLFYILSFKFDGFDGRFTSQELKPLDNIENLNYFRGGVCFLSNDFPDFHSDYNKSLCGQLSKGYKNVLLLGDSHSAHLYYGLSVAFSHEINIVQANTSGCKVNVNAKNPIRCHDLYQYIFNEYLVDNKNEIKEIWLASRWDKEDDGKILEAIQRIRSINPELRVVVFGPIPEYDFDLPKLMALDNIFNRSLVSKSLRRAPYEVDEYLSKKFDGVIDKVSYISIYKLLCENTQCSYLTPQGSPMQFDYGHLTKNGSVYLSGKIKDQYESLD
ncbi:hypothetical protein CWN85_13935 [Vibrio splendidus]|uniref:acyltransferase family protein n=1 Tax=Vibrio splendidus TaxID=29497 RepID=UPI000D33EE69|nr:acyltransferase family protein [Vibrio splendidus]PTP07414.1 hypothetical protein CWN86_10950 [Vibrio splendidus]PTP23077.1 hypothetical protein CWN85_13935 [Vibrio splendidus]